MMISKILELNKSTLNKVNKFIEGLSMVINIKFDHDEENKLFVYIQGPERKEKD